MIKSCNKLKLKCFADAKTYLKENTGCLTNLLPICALRHCTSSNYPCFYSFHKDKNMEKVETKWKQAGAELGQAQYKIG